MNAMAAVAHEAPIVAFDSMRNRVREFVARHSLTYESVDARDIARTPLAILGTAPRPRRR